MPQYQIKLGGKTYNVAAPNEEAAVHAATIAAGGRQQGTAEDVTKSFLAGIPRGVTGIAGMGGDLRHLARMGLKKAGMSDQQINAMRGMIGAAFNSTGRTMNTSVNNRPLNARNMATNAPDTAQVRAAVARAPVVGQAAGAVVNRQPQTRAGRYADVVGQFIPNALMPGPKGLGAIGQGAVRTANVVAPAVASEAAGQYVEDHDGTPGQAAAARLAGGLGGGVATGAATATRIVPNAAQAAASVPLRVVSGIEEAGSRVARMVGMEPGVAAVGPQHTEQALKIVNGLARRAGVSPDDLMANPLAQAGKPVTAAEAMGRTGMGHLTALGRRSGSTPDQLEALIASRMEAAPARVIDDVTDVTGLDPTFVGGDLEATAAKLREAARPLYDTAYEITPQSTRLEAILARPSAQEAMKRAVKIAREEGVDPNSLGLFDMEIPRSPVQGASPMPDVGDIAAVRAGMKDAGHALRREQGPSLLEFISKNGGMREMGELGAMDAQTWHRVRPFMSKLMTETGDSADGMAMRAWESGYFPELQARPDPDALFAAIREELAGKPRYGRTAADAGERVAGLASLDDELSRAGIDLHGRTNAEVAEALGRYRGDGEGLEYLAAYGQAPRPQYGPVMGEVPSMRALDYVKRGLDDVVNDYRNPVTRRLELNTEGRAVSNTLHELREELTTLNPAYGEALKVSGEPLRLELAFKDGPKLLSARVNEREFLKRIAKMSTLEKQTLLAGWAESVNSSARNGRLRLRDYRNPALQSKIAHLIGRDPAAELMRRIELEQSLARGNRMSPGSNSVTAEVLEANREMDRGVGLIGDFQRRLDAGQGLVRSATGTATNAVVSPVAGFMRGVQAPYGQAVRDEVGRLLMLSPEELAEELRRVGARNTGIRMPLPGPRSTALLAAPGLLGAIRAPEEEQR